MNERARWQQRHTLVSMIGIVLLCGMAWKAYHYTAQWARVRYAITSFTLVSQHVDTETARRMYEWLGLQQGMGKFIDPDYEHLTKMMVDTFPIVGRVSWSRYSPQSLSCSVYGVQPLCIINQQYVAGDNGKLYSIDLFTDGLRGIPELSVRRAWLDGAHFPQVYAFLSSLPRSFLALFDCVFHDPSLVVVTPKESLDLPHRCVCIIDTRSVSALPDTVTLMSMCQDDAHDAVHSFDFRFPGPPLTRCITHKELMHLQKI